LDLPSLFDFFLSVLSDISCKQCLIV